MINYRILDELNELAKIIPRQRNYSQLIYTFAFGLLSISLSAYNFVQSELPLPDIRSVYRHMSELLIIKPFMLTNLSYLPQILDQYKNITTNENVSNALYILAVDAMSSTPFCNVRKNLSINGVISNDMNADEFFY